MHFCSMMQNEQVRRHAAIVALDLIREAFKSHESLLASNSYHRLLQLSLSTVPNFMIQLFGTSPQVIFSCTGQFMKVLLNPFSHLLCIPPKCEGKRHLACQIWF